MLQTKADKESTNEALSLLLPIDEFTKVKDKVKKLHNTLEPLLNSEDLMNRLFKKLEMMKINTDS